MTANPNLPQSGVELVALNAPAFTKAMERANKIIEQQGKVAEKAGQQAAKAADGSNKFGTSIGNLITKFTTGNPAFQRATGFLQQFGVELSALPVGAIAAAGAVAALATAFIALGQRGAPLVGLAESFDRLTASIGVTGQVLLTDLRQAAAGTVSDFELIRLANTALAGAVGEFGQQFGEKLPKLLEIARTQARATGQSVDFLFQSLITGVKRGSPLLIDNTGLVLKVSQANQDYADSIGKTVEQLTAEDKQIALLNATVEAGQIAIENLGGAQETAAEKIARANATVTNILDKLALAVQPAYGAILDAQQGFLNQLEQLATALGPVITEIANFIGTLVSGTINNLRMLFQPIVDLVSGIAPYVTLALRTINQIAALVSGLLQRVTGELFSFTGGLKELPRQLFEGAAAAFGSFANGIIQVANQLIFPAVLGIAQFIADFLIGLSPPKKGPLHFIDQGGKNMMLAWLEGIAGVPLDPVEQVAAEVEMLLGNIGSLSQKQVETRLAQLDAALLPFQQRLDIVKSTFEAISAPAEAALNAIDRQIGQALEALGQGDQRAAALIRSLDAQRDSIQRTLDGQQAIVDAAQIQYALANAQQIRERTLLQIQLARVAVEEKITRKQKERTGGRIPQPRTPTGGAAPTLPETSGGVVGPTLPTDSVLGDITGQTAVDEALAGLTGAFEGQIDTSALQDFQSNTGKLNQLLGTIGSVDVGGRIAARFDGIREGIEGALEDARSAVEIKVAEIGAFFTDATRPGTLPYFFQVSLPSGINNARTGIETAINSVLSIFDPYIAGTPANVVVNTIRNLTDPEVEGSIPYELGLIGANINSQLNRTLTNVSAFFAMVFDPNQEGSAAAAVIGFIDGLINPETEGSIPYTIGQIGANINSQLNRTITNVSAFFAMIFDPNREGTPAYVVVTFVQHIIDGIVTLFSSLPAGIQAALQGLGLIAFNFIVKPIEGVLNSLIGLFERAIKGLLQSIIDIIRPQVGTVLDVGGVLTNAIETLQSAQAAVNFGRINIEAPAFLTATPAGTTNNTTVNNTFNINAPGAAEFAIRNAAVIAAGGG